MIAAITVFGRGNNAVMSPEFFACRNTNLHAGNSDLRQKKVVKKQISQI